MNKCACYITSFYSDIRSQNSLLVLDDLTAVLYNVNRRHLKPGLLRSELHKTAPRLSKAEAHCM